MYSKKNKHLTFSPWLSRDRPIRIDFYDTFFFYSFRWFIDSYPFVLLWIRVLWTLFVSLFSTILFHITFESKYTQFHAVPCHFGILIMICEHKFDVKRHFNWIQSFDLMFVYSWFRIERIMFLFLFRNLGKKRARTRIRTWNEIQLKNA